MNSHHNQDKKDQSLDEDLQRLDHSYHSEEAEAPPALIDQAILNQARRAVEPNNNWLKSGWIQGATTAALVVLTITVFTFQRDTGQLDNSSGAPFDIPDKKIPSPAASSAADQATNPTVGQSASHDSDFSANPKEHMPASAPVSIQADRATNEAVDPDTARKEAQDRQRDQRNMRRQMSAPPVPPDAAKSHESEPPVEEALIEEALIRELEQPDTFGALPEDKLQLILDEILVLKRTGDASWTDRLAEFKNLYPNYPLPAELQTEDE